MFQGDNISRLMLMKLGDARHLSPNLFTFSAILSATTTDPIVGQDSTSELGQQDSYPGKKRARILLYYVGHCTSFWRNILKT